MRLKTNSLAAIAFCAGLGLGAQQGFAQGVPGRAPSGPVNPEQTMPQPGPNMPREIQPTIPGQPAPGIPQTQPLPGQPGTIPEQIAPPDAGSPRGMVISSDHVRKAQQALKAHGLNPGMDGKLDDKTQQALRDFQKANNLPATGVLDQKTAAKLGVTINEQTNSPGRSDDALPRSGGSMR